ncbi:hypothetical protein JCM10212_003884 [Sporobolomyces blumeae]
MDNIPVDAPPPAGFQQQQDPHLAAAAAPEPGLQFEEDLKDIPQALAGSSYDASRGGASGSFTNQPTLVYPSVLAPPPQPHHFAPAPGIPPNAPPQSLPPLAPQPVVGPDGSLQPPPAKRPRGRPRKIPGVDSRPTPSQGTTAGRGRPKGTRGRGRGRGARGRGRGGKRGRVSSDEDDEPMGDSTDSEDEKEDKEVNLNEEVDDDFGPEGKQAATTKFGRKISKPKTFIPTNKPTIHRRKRQTPLTLEANLMCEVCREGHSPPGNQLVICDACSKGWHQLCAEPQITAEVVASDLPYYCTECDKKMSEMRKVEDVTVGEWTDGRGEDKGLAAALPVPPPAAEPGAEGAENPDAAQPAAVVPEVDKEAEKAKPYSEILKKEWLLSLPLNTLVGYILSIEKKFAPSPEDGLPIWPKDLPGVLQAAKEARVQEALERERRLEREAEELAAAAAAGTPGGTTTNSEAGTPLSFDPFPGEPAARTAASRRLQDEREGREKNQEKNRAQQEATNQQRQNEQQQQQQQLAQQQQRPPSSHSSLPPFLRGTFQAQPALAMNGGTGDIQVGGASSSLANGAASSSGQAGHGHSPLVHPSHSQHVSAMAQQQAQAQRYPAYNSYATPQTSAQGFTSYGGAAAPGGAAGAYQTPTAGAYANLYAQQPSAAGQAQADPGANGYSPHQWNGMSRSQSGPGQ